MLEKVDTCQFCHNDDLQSFCDLGVSPLSNSFLRKEQLSEKEPLYPLHAKVCTRCFLVQVPMFERPEHIFREYVYFSSYSKSWLEHSRSYSEKIIRRFGYGEKSFVVEVASNDGYLLKEFKERGIPVLGIEPAENVAIVAQSSAGIPTLVKFFGLNTAKELTSIGHHADLLIGNNVLAHVPDINDFVAGMKHLLAKNGVVTMEFPHLLQLIKENQFDTIYHEHFSYLSFFTVKKIFEHHGLKMFDVEELETHGGSLRIYACHVEDAEKSVSPAVNALLEKERKFGIESLELYREFSQRVKLLKQKLVGFLKQAKQEGKLVVGYGAPAKGNTLLNYCGVTTELLPFTVDISPYKQSKFLPGVHIPVRHPDEIRAAKPHYVLILPWNIKSEVMQQLSYIRSWGGQFVLPIPDVEVVP